jgi:hypothetical protein
MVRLDVALHLLGFAIGNFGAVSDESVRASGFEGKREEVLTCSFRYALADWLFCGRWMVTSGVGRAEERAVESGSKISSC